MRFIVTITAPDNPELEQDLGALFSWADKVYLLCGIRTALRDYCNMRYGIDAGPGFNQQLRIHVANAEDKQPSR